MIIFACVHMYITQPILLIELEMPTQNLKNKKDFNPNLKINKSIVSEMAKNLPHSAATNHPNSNKQSIP